jgi:hypothetical protein
MFDKTATLCQKKAPAGILKRFHPKSQPKFDEPVKSQNPDSFVKRSSSRCANLSGVGRTYLRRSDFEMQRNAEIGLFTEMSNFRERRPC